MTNFLISIFDELIAILPYIIAHKNISTYKYHIREYLYMIFIILALHYPFGLIGWSYASIPIYVIPIIFTYIKCRDIIKSTTLNAFIYLIIIFNSSFIGLIFIKFFNMNIQVYTKEFYFITFVIYISLFVISKVVGYLHRRNKGVVNNIFNSNYRWIIFLIIIITWLGFYININWNISNDPSFLTGINGIMFISYVFVLIIICAILTIFVKKEVDFKAKQAHYESLHEYTANLEKLYMDMRKFRHDYVNILSSISAYLDQEDVNGLKKYFYESIYPLDKAIENKDFKLGLLKNIEIIELKGLLSMKLIRAQELNLNVNVDIVEPISNINMDIVDLVRILGILLDNAIEAALESDEKKVEIGIIKKDPTVIIIVINSFKGNSLQVSRMFTEGFSTKGENRGLGLSNMKQILNQYKNVTLDTYIEKNSFIQCIDINNKSK